MKKILFPIVLMASTLLTTGCSSVTGDIYSLNSGYYSNDYVYSVGYYGYRPYWGYRYYSGPARVDTWQGCCYQRGGSCTTGCCNGCYERRW